MGWKGELGMGRPGRVELLRKESQPGRVESQEGEGSQVPSSPVSPVGAWVPRGARELRQGRWREQQPVRGGEKVSFGSVKLEVLMEKASCGPDSWEAGHRSLA